MKKTTIRKKQLVTVMFLFASVSLVLPVAMPVDIITEEGLGYPVPEPVDSLTPLAGFRSIASLDMRYDSLWMQFDTVDRQVAGTSTKGRELVAYRMSTAGDTTPEGTLKPAAVIQGTLHPREWAATEVVASVFEWLALEAETDAVARFLLENTVTVIHPLADRDGFIQTQTYFDRTVGGGNTGRPGSDGRVRRKNMRDVDELIDTVGDAELGVQVNRNHIHGFGAGGSSDPRSGEYRGPAPASEPEAQATYQAADFAQVAGFDRIRYFNDVHTAGQLIYVMIEGEPGHDAVAQRVYRSMAAASLAITGRVYAAILDTVPIGSTDWYFSRTYGCVSYTTEVRPKDGVLANPSILPESEIDAARRELRPAIAAGLYHMAGPPVLIEVAIYHEADGDAPSPDPVYHERRQFNALSETRERSVLENGILAQGQRYLAVLRFNKPMRIQNPDTGEVEAHPGQAALPPFVELGSVTGTEATWVFNEGPLGHGRYPGDTLLVTLDLSSPEVCPGEFPLEIFATDLTQGLLDSNPLTVVDWSPGGWVNYEDTAGDPGISGGIDGLSRLTIENPLVTGDCETNSLLPWIAADVGDPNIAGITRGGGENFQVISGGKVFGGGTDTFHLVYQEFIGDTVITARVAGLTPEAATSSIGLTLRASLEANARHATILFRNNGSSHQMKFVRRRGRLTQTTSSTDLQDTWVRIERQGGEFIGYHSPNGIIWTEIGRVDVDMPETIIGGIAATAINTIGNEVVFSEVSNLYIGAPPEPRFLRGDGNGDGRVNIADPSYIAGIIFGLSVAPITCEAAADANGDGGVNIADPTYIANFLFGIGPAAAPPAPFPECALVTPDEPLSCLGTEGCLE